MEAEQYEPEQDVPPPTQTDFDDVEPAPQPGEQGDPGAVDEDGVPKEIQILETPEDIQERREQVLTRYAAFKEATKSRRQRLEEARLFMYFKRDADELESWIHEKLQTASDESYRDPTNLQVTQ